MVDGDHTIMIDVVLRMTDDSIDMIGIRMTIVISETGSVGEVVLPDENAIRTTLRLE